MRKSIVLLQLLLFALLISSLPLLSSCSDDEPDYLVGYYLTIDSQITLKLNDVEDEQATAADNSVDIISYTVRRMRAALQEAYPASTHQGNDVAVLTSLNDIYRAYKLAYSDFEGYTVCVLTLYRAKMDGDIVVGSQPITTYHFGALPKDVVPEAI